MKTTMTIWMKDSKGTRAEQGTGKERENKYHLQDTMKGRKLAQQLEGVMRHEKKVWGNKHWAMLAPNNTKVEQQSKKKGYERTEH